MVETQVPPLSQEDPLEKDMQPTPVFLPAKSLKESDTTQGLKQQTKEALEGATALLNLADFGLLTSRTVGE